MTDNPYRVGAELNQSVFVTTGNDIQGFRVERYLGIVRGIIVRAPSIGQSFLGQFRQIAGGNIQEYMDVCEAARHEAYQHMIAHAQEIGANAIIGMRYDATEFMQGVTEVLAYGTAVVAVPTDR